MGQKANGEWFIFPLLLVPRGFKALKKMVKLEFQTKDYKTLLYTLKSSLPTSKLCYSFIHFPRF